MSDERIKCESCSAEFEPLIEKRAEGDLEFLFFRCPSCGARYTVAVTDPALREQIREYTELAEEGRQRRLTESQYLYLQKLKEENVARSKELRKRYGGSD
jgi:DNA-directed RNA polymerase subunit RPC12/RpoP